MRVELERTLTAWRRYLKLQPWRRIDSDALFRVDDHRSEEHYYASILGCLGTMYGFALNRGEEGLQDMGGLVEQDLDADQASSTSTSICISRHDEPAPRWYRRFLRESLGLKKGLRDAPLIYVNDGKRGVRPPDAGEVRLLADTLEAVVSLLEHDALTPPIFKPGSPMPCVVLRADGSVEVTEVTPEFRLPRVEPYRLAPHRRDALRELPRLDSIDFVSCSLAPALVNGFKIRMLIVVDAESDCILAGECMELDDRETIAERLFAVHEGVNAAERMGLPREIQTDSRFFYDVFKEALSEIEVRVTCFERIPALERIRGNFARFLDGGSESGETDRP